MMVGWLVERQGDVVEEGKVGGCLAYVTLRILQSWVHIRD